jgi:hypothetical protein
LYIQRTTSPPSASPREKPFLNRLQEATQS